MIEEPTTHDVEDLPPVDSTVARRRQEQLAADIRRFVEGGGEIQRIGVLSRSVEETRPTWCIDAKNQEKADRAALMERG